MKRYVRAAAAAGALIAGLVVTHPALAYKSGAH
jgi:hypothetical protein